MTPDKPSAPEEGEIDEINYRLEFDEAANQLVGVVFAASSFTVSLHDLNQKIDAEGYLSFYFATNSREQFLRKVNNSHSGSYAIGERRDAKIKITLSKDKLCARVQTSMPYGGLPLSLDLIQAEIKKNKLDRRCIDKEQLRTLIKSKAEVDLILARAVPAVDGSDATLTALVESTLATQKNTTSAATIDQREVFEFVVVDPGCPLMRKIPATKGEDGLDVTGKKIKALAGTDYHFEKPFTGVEVSSDDEHLLIACIKGHPINNKHGVKVDPLMVLDAVNIHSGNVDFDGSLVVAKDIESGYKVNVTGDVLVKGSIFKAKVKAGGSIIVNGGIQADDIDGEKGCHLNAQGDVRAKYVHHGDIRSQGSVHIAEYIMQSSIIAKGEINAGKERGKGCIIGGYSYSDSGVSAKVLGSDAYITTTLKLGSDDELKTPLRQLKCKHKRRIGEERQLDLILTKIRSLDGPTKVGQLTLDKARKVENTLILLRSKIDELAKRIQDLELQVESTDHLQVDVSGHIYPNVRIAINGQSWHCETVCNKVVVMAGEDEMIVAPKP